jgi:hypothetical protein
MLRGTYFERDLDKYADWFYYYAEKSHVNPYILVEETPGIVKVPICILSFRWMGKLLIQKIT